MIAWFMIRSRSWIIPELSMSRMDPRVRSGERFAGSGWVQEKWTVGNSGLDTDDDSFIKGLNNQCVICAVTLEVSNLILSMNYTDKLFVRLFVRSFARYALHGVRHSWRNFTQILIHCRYCLQNESYVEIRSRTDQLQSMDERHGALRGNDVIWSQIEAKRAFRYVSQTRYMI